MELINFEEFDNLRDEGRDDNNWGVDEQINILAIKINHIIKRLNELTRK